jgi:hypothetical protein
VDFDWAKWAITVNGPVLADTLEDDLQIYDHIHVPAELVCVTSIAATTESSEVDSEDDTIEKEKIHMDDQVDLDTTVNEYEMRRVGFIPISILDMYRYKNSII